MKPWKRKAIQQYGWWPLLGEPVKALDGPRVTMTFPNADTARHKIVEHAIGGNRIVMRCLCGWQFGCNDLATADAAADAHIDGLDA